MEDSRQTTQSHSCATNEFLPGCIDVGESFRLDSKKLLPCVQSKDTDEMLKLVCKELLNKNFNTAQ